MKVKKKGLQLAKRLCATALVLVMATLSPLQTFATSKRTTYISDLKMGFGQDMDEARSWLESQGYTVIDQDFNKDSARLSLSGMYNEDKAVMLGYKTTKDPKMAITDIKAMNMTGGYSFDDYQTLLKKEEKEIKLFLEDFYSTLNEYRENYKNGRSKAVIAHDNLNMLYDDDTQHYLGDLLLQDTKQELSEEAYNALSDDEKKNHADMVTILMQANGKAVLSIEQNLYYGADTDTEASFVERLAELGDYETFEMKYSNSLPKNTGINELYAKMDVAYGDTALMLAEKIPSFREYMTAYTEHELFGEEDEAKIEAYFQEKGDELGIVYWKNARDLYLSLQEITFEEGSLYDLLVSDEYDFEGEDRYYLYPMASVLSPGQIACLPYVSFVQMFNVALTDEDGFRLIHDSMETAVDESAMKASIYEGINRSLFGASSVAITTDARALTNSSTRGYEENWVGLPISNLATVLVCMSVVSAVTSGVTLYIAKKNVKKAVEIQLGYIPKPEIPPTPQNPSVPSAPEQEVADNVITDLNTSVESSNSSIDVDDMSDAGMEQFDQTYSDKATSKMPRYIGYAFCVAAIVMGVASIVKTYYDLKAYYRQERTPIPHYMVDATTGDGTIKNFTYYAVVTCNRKELGFKTSDIAKDESVLANFGDLKGDVGKEWLALYYTKNSAAGKPITTDLLVQSGSSDLKTGYQPVSMFGSKALVNINDEKYCYGTTNGLYMMFKRDESIDLGGSTFAGGYAMLLAALSAVLGFAATSIIYRRKEEEGEVA